MNGLADTHARMRTQTGTTHAYIHTRRTHRSLYLGDKTRNKLLSFGLRGLGCGTAEGNSANSSFLYSSLAFALSGPTERHLEATAAGPQCLETVAAAAGPRMRCDDAFLFRLDWLQHAPSALAHATARFRLLARKYPATAASRALDDEWSAGNLSPRPGWDCAPCARMPVASVSFHAPSKYL